MTAQERAAILNSAATDADYGFSYHCYPLVTAYLEHWQPGSPHERLLEELNGPVILELVRAISGIAEIVKLDGQATLYAPGHFLRPHNDEESQRGRRVAYVLNLTAGEWQPHWGGYLNFFTPDWDIEQAFRPHFNCLNLFKVPQWHASVRWRRRLPSPATRSLAGPAAASSWLLVRRDRLHRQAKKKRREIALPPPVFVTSV